MVDFFFFLAPACKRLKTRSCKFFFFLYFLNLKVILCKDSFEVLEDETCIFMTITTMMIIVVIIDNYRDILNVTLMLVSGHNLKIYPIILEQYQKKKISV